MRLFKYYFSLLGQFMKRWGSYVALFVGITLTLNVIVVPILAKLVDLVADAGGVAFIDLSNFGYIVTERPLATVGFLAILALLLFIVYLQFTFTIISVHIINQRRPLVPHLIGELFASAIKRFNLKTFLLFIPYFLFVVPFSQIAWRSQLLSKIRIPDFIIDVVDTDGIGAIIHLAIIIIAIICAVRLLPLLPTVVLGQHAHPLKTSLQATKHHGWKIFFQLVIFSFLNGIIATVITGVIFGIQRFADSNLVGQALGLATFNMGFIELFTQFMTALSLMMVTVYAIQLADDAGLIEPLQTPTVHLSPRRKIAYRAVAGAALLVVGGSFAFYNSAYLSGLINANPLVISHRGVDNGNGVQNTVDSLNKTAKLKPDLVEMDIRETKDHKFVVMHDPTLKALAGINKDVHDMTITQLKKVTLHEKGNTAKVASFDDYLANAENDHQRLLVEIKTSKRDSKNMFKNFVNRYEKRLLKDNDEVHSLDYEAVLQVKKLAPRLFVSYIMSYDLIYPNTPADAYSAEKTTLTPTFVSESQEQHKPVYAWTVDDELSMSQMLYLGTDGIITDNMSELRAVMKRGTDHPSYADQLIRFNQNLQEQFNTDDDA